MDYLKWKEEYSVGFELFDQQHYHLFSMLNDLMEKHGSDIDSDLSSEILNNLTIYILNHFKDEEKYMSEFGYEDYEDHLSKHHDLTERVIKLNQDSLKEMERLPSDLLSLLKGWWINHILKEDMKYKSFFQNLTVV